MRLDLYDHSTFDRGASRLKESLWIFCQCLFFLNPVPWPSRLRTFLLRLFGADIGRGFVIRSFVNISFPWRFTAGDHVWIGEGTSILSLAPVRLGSHICISQRAFLCTGSHETESDRFALRTLPITIEDQVWIAAQAFIGPGVTAGQGSIISAGTILMKSVSPGSFAKGNPAQVSPKRR